MLYGIIVLCLCVLFLAARLIIMVPAGTIAVRKTHNHFRGLAPGIHLRWPWQHFERHDFHFYNSDKQTYCVSSRDGARVHVRIAVDWTEFQRVNFRSTLDLIAPIRTTIGKYPVDAILSSPRVRNELEWAIRSTSHENGHFFFRLEVLSILREELFGSVMSEVSNADAPIAQPLAQPAQIPPPHRAPLRCIHGGKYGTGYHSRHNPRSPPPPHLRLYRGGNDDGAA